MEYYFAPMEGITGYIFRNAHHACFGGVDRYYTPFLTPKQGKSFTSREWNDVLPEHNENIFVIPQIMTNQAEGFLKVAGYLKEFGYTEVNLNLGCPSGTVVAKKKGAGFLAFPRELDEFLERIFAKADLKISIKTRIGKEDPDEFGTLLEIFNKYPLEKLIIHPRVQTDSYKNTPNLEAFAQALKNSKNPVCYNGDLFSAEKIAAFIQQFPETDSLMLGRGLLVNPALLTGSVPATSQLCSFLDKLVTDYSEILSGERDVLFKMKELWFYLGMLFPDGEKHLKKIRKSQKLAEYKNIVNALLDSCPMQSPDSFFF